MHINLKYDKGKLFWHHGGTVYTMSEKELPMDTIPQVAAAMQTILNDVAETAALKLAVRLNVTTGALEGPTLEHGCTADHHTALADHPVPSAALRIADLGFFALDELARVSQAGGYWLTRLQVQTGVYVAGQR